MDAHYEWALHGPYLDKSLIRNYMWYNIAGEIMDYAPNVRFCEVVLNGEYKGLYVMTETITNGTDCRVNISDLWMIRRRPAMYCGWTGAARMI